MQEARKYASQLDRRYIDIQDITSSANFPNVVPATKRPPKNQGAQLHWRSLADYFVITVFGGPINKIPEPSG
jgi:hypothetical protein